MWRPSDRIILALRVSLFGFIVNCKPSEPFLSLYLNQTKRLSEEQLATQVFPWSYVGTFALLVPFGLAAEVIGCRPVIFTGLLCREATRILLIFGEGVGQLALMQLAYGAGAAVDAIYFAYVYAVAPSDEFAMLTSAVLAAYHAGNVVGSLLGEMLISWMMPAWRSDTTPLFYMSWAGCTLGVLAFMALPPPRRQLQPSLAHHLLRSGFKPTARALLALWSSRESLFWLLWWLLCASGNLLALGYFQLQMLQVSPSAPFGSLEAGVEAGLVFGAICAYFFARLTARRPTALLSLTSLLRAAALGGAALGARAGDVALPFGLNIFAAALFGYQDAAGRVRLAEATCAVEPGRAPLLFSANTLAAQGVAAAFGAAAGVSWTANDYFIAAAAMQAAVALGAAVFSLQAQRQPLVTVSAARSESDVWAQVGTSVGVQQQ